MLSLSADSSSHLFLPGGGGLSGYEDRYTTLSGNSLATFVAECALPILRGDHSLSLAAFGGGGYISNSAFFTAMRFTMPMFDAGVSVNYEFVGNDAALLKSLFLTSVPLSVRVTFPLFVSQPVAGEAAVAMRWRLGISSSL